MEFREVLFSFTVILWICAYFVGVVPVDEQNKQLLDKIEQMKLEQNARTETISHMQLELKQLQNNDPKAIEKVLRERYNYCRENETIGVIYTPAKKLANP